MQTLITFLLCQRIITISLRLEFSLSIYLSQLLLQKSKANYWFSFVSGLSGTMNENSFSNGRGRRRKIRSVNKSSSMNNNSSCRLRETIMSTYNFEYGYLNQTTVSIKRCFGGNKDPKNYQCQPKKQRLKCYRLRLNSSNTTEYTLGYLEHLECEEYCICRRGNCNGKKPVKPMLCPVG